MAKYKKKRARELQHDRFRDTAMTLMDRLGNALEGKGRTILYGIGGLVLASVLAGLVIHWFHRKRDEAQLALGRAIAIAATPVGSTTAPDPTGQSFTSEQERARKAIEEFQKVVAKYGEPYRTEAKYFIATNETYLDRNKAIADLTELTRSSISDVATLSKFALAQAKEADGKYDEAAQLYSDLARQNGVVVTPDTANLRLAICYEKLGKKKEAADLLFNIVDAGRKARDSEGNPAPQTVAARQAADELEKLDPDRYAQLTPQAPPAGLPF